MDILYFIGYDIDEELPWHSTISRTRQLFPEILFEEAFTKVFALCVSKGMVSGHTQTIDSAPIKANASMDSLELKVPKEDLETHLHQLRHISRNKAPFRKSIANKASKEQQTLSANKQELSALKSRNKKWAKDQALHWAFVEMTNAQEQGLRWGNCVADTGYSSGENYAFLEQQTNLQSFIPPHVTYKGGL